MRLGQVIGAACGNYIVMLGIALAFIVFGAPYVLWLLGGILRALSSFGGA